MGNKISPKLVQAYNTVSTTGSAAPSTSKKAPATKICSAAAPEPPATNPTPSNTEITKSGTPPETPPSPQPLSPEDQATYDTLKTSFGKACNDRDTAKKNAFAIKDKLYELKDLLERLENSPEDKSGKEYKNKLKLTKDAINTNMTKYTKEYNAYRSAYYLAYEYRDALNEINDAYHQPLWDIPEYMQSEQLPSPEMLKGILNF